MWVLREGRRLTSRFQNRHPQVAIRVDLIAFSNREWNRDMDKAAVPSTDDHFRAAAHGCVNGVMRQSQAVNAVEWIRGHASDEIAGINVFEIQFDPLIGEVGVDSIFQEQTNVTELCIS